MSQTWLGDYVNVCTLHIWIVQAIYCAFQCISYSNRIIWDNITRRLLNPGRAHTVVKLECRHVAFRIGCFNLGIMQIILSKYSWVVIGSSRGTITRSNCNVPMLSVQQCYVSLGSSLESSIVGSNGSPIQLSTTPYTAKPSFAPSKTSASSDVTAKSSGRSTGRSKPRPPRTPTTSPRGLTSNSCDLYFSRGTWDGRICRRALGCCYSYNHNLDRDHIDR